MIIKNVIQLGNPKLRKKSKPVLRTQLAPVKKTIKNLTDSMRFHGLVGMAAPQIGRNVRIFVTEIRKTPSRNPKNIDGLRFFINPQIVWTSKKEVIGFEGCGSVAYGELFGPVKRPQKVIVEALNEKGKSFTLKAEGLLARVIQHENDHLDGIEFLEKVTDITKLLSKEEYRKRSRRKKR